MAPVDYDEYWSEEAKQLKPPSLAGFVQQFTGMADVITLHVGLPPAQSFPITSMHFTSMLDKATQIDISTANQVNTAQQYIFSKGYEPLLQWIRSMVDRCHKPQIPYDVVATNGAVHALSCCVSCLAERADFLLCDEFTYAHALECIFIPRGLKLLLVHMDEEGMDPHHLEQLLTHTGSSNTGRQPRLLYAIPTGHNPTGKVMSLARKQQIYKVCQEHGVIILEDDAYYWLQFPSSSSSTTSSTASSNGSLQHQEQAMPGLQLQPTFLSLDTDGRVVRIDTFAKLLGPGYRLGWITGPPQLVSKLAMQVQATTVGPSSLSQVVVAQMLQQEGVSAFECFLKRQQHLYATGAHIAAQMASKYLTGLADWQVPAAGMFMWFKLKGVPDVSKEVLQQLVAQRVVVVPGCLFWADTEAANSSAPCPFFRLTFCTAKPQELEEGFRRLASAIQALQLLADRMKTAADKRDSKTLYRLINGAAGKKAPAVAQALRAMT